MRWAESGGGRALKGFSNHLSGGQEATWPGKGAGRGRQIWFTVPGPLAFHEPEPGTSLSWASVSASSERSFSWRKVGDHQQPRDSGLSVLKPGASRANGDDLSTTTPPPISAQKEALLRMLPD